MRAKFARALRKWADLIDPRINPSDAIKIRINVDTRDAMKQIDEFQEAVKRSIAASDMLKARVPLT